MKIAEKTPHVNTHWRDTWTHNKGKTHQKGMKTHQKGNTIESDLSFMFIGFLTVGEFFHKKKQSAKRREHMSSAQIDVAKRKLDTHDNHRKKHHTWTHIARTHEHTTKGKRIKEAWTHTKRETQLKLSCFSCFSCSSVFLHLGISSTKRGKTQRGESTCHLHKDTSQKETGHTWKSQKEQPHMNTYRKDTWTHNKGKTHPKGMKTHQKGNTIERILSFIFIGFLTCGDFAQRGESTCHLHK